MEQKEPALESLGKRIRTLRKEEGYSQEGFADAAGIERSYMGSIERGERNPTFMKIYNIVKALKMSLSDFFKYRK